MQFKVISSAASPLALMRIIKPSVNAALWAVTSVSVLGFSQSANVWAANIESRGGSGGESSNGTNGMDGVQGTNGLGGVGGDGGAGTGTPAGAGIGGFGGALGASTVDPSSIVTITGGDGLAGTNGTLSQNKDAGGGGGGGAGGAGVISTEVIFDSQTMINGGSGGNGGNGASANMSSEKSGSSAGGGGDGGVGIYYGNATTATNSGTVRGGNGGGGGNGSDGQNIKASGSLVSHDGGSSGNGGKGGNAALFNDGVTINNTTSGLIYGGTGGAAGNAGHGGNSDGAISGVPSIGGVGGQGGKGEDGGHGIKVFGGGTLNNDGTINGGSGGQGGKGGQGGYAFNSSSSGGAGGNGGNGGTAVIFTETAILANKGLISGGDGSIGGEGGGSGTTQGTIGNVKSGDGGNGGNGGIAVQLSGTHNIVTNSGGSIVGGDGKNGGKGGDPFLDNRYSNHGRFSYSGHGGNGADAIQLGNASKINNERGNIQGGSGGTGGDQSSINVAAPPPGSGGIGGNAITASQGSIITNAGTIAGGAGGAGGLTPSEDYGVAGLGGYGILLSGADGKVINSGIISGGLSGNSLVHSFAISFTGGNSTLELHAGSSINGDVVAQKSGNIFILGGDDNAIFSGNISVETTGTAQYRGFQTNIKDGASLWSLTGNSQNWTIKKGVLQIGDGGTTGSVTGNVITGTDATTKGTLAFNLASDVVFSGLISGTGNVEKHSANIITLTSDNNYTGGTVISSGTLRLGNSGTIGSIIGNVTNNGILSFNRQDSLTFDGIISGSGSVSQIGTGTTVLVSDNTYTGATNVVVGNLQIGDGHITGNISGNASIDTNATFAFNRSDALNFNGVVSGTGLLQQIGTGALSLNGDSSAFSGRTLVTSGTILVHGTLGGAVDVALNGSLGGDGTIKGEAILDPGGASLVGRQGQVLTFEKDLSLAAGNNINVTLGAPSTNGLFYIQGNLTLNGLLNITDKGGFGPGLYRVFDYDGALTDDGFVIGSVPAGNSASMTIQTSVANQVNLVNTAGVSLNFWNGADTSKHGNGTINGGDGVWNNVNPNWTDADGIVSGSWKDDDFAIFAGFSGIVSLSDSIGTVTVSGMQFSTDGYHLQGDALILADTNTPIIRVDNNTTAIIEVELQGTQGLNKTDFGTLVLTGDSHYTGGTTVSEGILKLGNGGTAGSIAGDVSLKRTAYDYGTLAFNRSDIVTFTGTINGEGEVLHQGVGTTIFTADNSYSGGLRVEKGTVQAGIIKHAFGRGRLMVNNGATADLKGFDTTVSGLLNGKDGGGMIALGTGSLTLNQDFNSTFSGIISGAGGLKKNNSGSLTLSGVNNYDGATELNDGILKQGIQSAFSSTSAYTIGTAGTLMLNGFNTHMLSLSNNGVTDFGGEGGTILSILGNYTGSGLLLLNTVLGDDSSKTDLLQVGGDTSGTTSVKIKNRDGLGAQTNEGIKIVTVNGQSNGTFSLIGDYITKEGQQAVIAGAYAYSLHTGSVSAPADGNWYLRSELKNGKGPIINPAVPIYESYTQALQALNQLSTLQQRVGSRYWNSSVIPMTMKIADTRGISLVLNDTSIGMHGAWARIEGAHSRFKNTNSTIALKQDVNTFTMQTGIDGQFYESDFGKLLGGITAQYGKANSKVVSEHGDGLIDTQAWGLGSTLTWYAENGLYTDAQVQAMWYDSDLNSTTAGAQLINDNKGFGYALSIEAGKQTDLNNNWSLTPQAQFVWSSVKFDSFNDAWGTSVSSRRGGSLKARLGISADYRNAWQDEHGMTARSHIYGIFNLQQEYISKSKVTVANLEFDNKTDTIWGSVGFGGSYLWADDKYALYGEGSLSTSFNHFLESHSMKGSAGFRVKW